jgi:hypothetical protein
MEHAMGLSMHDRRVLADIERHLVHDDPRLDRTLREFRRDRGPRRGLTWVLLGPGVILMGLAIALHDGALLAPATVLGLLACRPRIRRPRAGGKP